MKIRSKVRVSALAALISLALAPLAAALSAPTVTPVSLGVSSAGWTWGLVTGAGAYRVLSSTGGGNISGDLSASTTYFYLTGMSTNTAAAVTIEASTGATTADSPVTTAYSAAAQPSGTMLLGTNLNQPTLSWLVNGNPAGTNYAVQWSSAGGTPVLFSTTPAIVAGSATATVPDLPGTGDFYNLSVAAYNRAGVATGFDVAVTTAIPVLYGQPVISSATFADGISSITWYWSASTGATNYQLFSATGGAVSPLLPGTQLSYIETGLTANTSYPNYVVPFVGATASTASAPYSRFTLADRPTGLTASSLNNFYETLTWSGATNPSNTSYDALWWTGVTSTITVSSSATSALLGPLPAGGTAYFAVRARNGEGIATDFDASLYGVVPSTYFTVGVTTIGPTFSGTLLFAIPTGAISLTVSSNTFATQTSLSISTTAATHPAGAGFAAVPGMPTLLGQNGINFTITATDPFGAPLQPSRPIQIAMNYVASAVAGVNQDRLTIARYDNAASAWVSLLTERQAGSLAALTEHLSDFAVLSATPGSSLSAITVGPNPLRPLVNPGTVFTFRGLPPDARVRIFSYVGEKLADVSADASGLVTWDGRSARGSIVASGVYIAVIQGAGTKRTMRLAIER